MNRLKLIVISLVFVLLYSCSSNDQSDTVEPEIEVVLELDDGSVWKRKFYVGSRLIVNEGLYINDTINSGLFRQYNRNGTLDWEANYEFGEIKGLFRSYHEGYEKNFLHKEGTVLNDKQVGTWKYFYPNGNPKAVEIYDSTGNVIYGVTFTPDGRFEREKIFE